MQLSWLIQGLLTGIVTTRYPAAGEPQPPGWRGRPLLTPEACLAPQGCFACIAVCLPQALRLGGTSDRGASLVLDYARCIMCGLCVPACPPGALAMRPDYRLAVRRAEDLRVTVQWETPERP